MTNNQISHKQIIINDLLINYYSVLPEKKTSVKTLLFLHGWEVDSKLWFKIIPKLIEKNYSLYFLDLPGFGQSQIPDTTYGLDDYKKIVYEFIEKLGLKNINLIGHSFGGSIAIKIASENPSFLTKLVLVNAAGIRQSSLLKNIKIKLAKIISPLFFPSFMQVVRIKIYELLGSEYLNNPPMSKIFSKIVSENLTSFLSMINKPTLIIMGDKDKVTPPLHGQEMNKKIKGSKLIILPTGHFSFIDQPEKFVRTLTAFI
ncbi:Alpha/beta hydrolase [Candidatus Roizmanbacteria bacterium]|nr:Alpha/beta hydrolase [Candidatus Roizmanbacteria bacterium]